MIPGGNGSLEFLWSMKVVGGGPFWPLLKVDVNIGGGSPWLMLLVVDIWGELLWPFPKLVPKG